MSAVAAPGPEMSMSTGGLKPFSSPTHSRLGWAGGAATSSEPHAAMVGARIARSNPAVEAVRRLVTKLGRAFTRPGSHSPLDIDGTAGHVTPLVNRQSFSAEASHNVRPLGDQGHPRCAVGGHPCRTQLNPASAAPDGPGNSAWVTFVWPRTRASGAICNACHRRQVHRPRPREGRRFRLRSRRIAAATGSIDSLRPSALVDRESAPRSSHCARSTASLSCRRRAFALISSG